MRLVQEEYLRTYSISYELRDRESLIPYGTKVSLDTQLRLLHT